MRLLTWNLRHGGGPRNMPAIALSILDHRPDAVILTEYRRTTGGQIGAVLADHGLSRQVCTDPPPGRNGILIAARAAAHIPARPSRPADAQAPLFHAAAPPTTWARTRHARATRHRITELDLPDLELSIAAVHIPPDGDPTRESVFQSAVQTASERRDRPFVLMGDFNAGRHHLDEEGATFSCTRLLGTLAALGYADAWRTLNPAGREFTWFSHEGSGFRIDHCFLSPPLAGRLSACRHSHKERQSGLSDHSMLLVDLA